MVLECMSGSEGYNEKSQRCTIGGVGVYEWFGGIS